MFSLRVGDDEVSMAFTKGSSIISSMTGSSIMVLVFARCALEVCDKKDGVKLNVVFALFVWQGEELANVGRENVLR